METIKEFDAKQHKPKDNFDPQCSIKVTSPICIGWVALDIIKELAPVANPVYLCHRLR